MLKVNKFKGINDMNEQAMDRATSSHLVTLPTEIDGANCFNCRNLILGDKTKGFCSHPLIKQFVNERMHCMFWDNRKSLKA